MYTVGVTLIMREYERIISSGLILMVYLFACANRLFIYLKDLIIISYDILENILMYFYSLMSK